MISYRSMDYPHDHINEKQLVERLDTLLPLEQTVIEQFSTGHQNLRNYYKGYFNSLVPLSDDDDSHSVKVNHRNLYIGVKRDAHGNCDGCPLKKSFHYAESGKQIRKFVGNREVFDIITHENRLAFFFNTIVERYPSQHAPFEVTAVTATTYKRCNFFILEPRDCLCYHKSFLAGWADMSSLSPLRLRREEKQ